VLLQGSLPGERWLVEHVHEHRDGNDICSIGALPTVIRIHKIRLHVSHVALYVENQSPARNQQRYSELQSFHKKPSTRPRPIVPSTCHMCHIWTRFFCGSDYISEIARAEPDGSAILGSGGAMVEARCQSVFTVEKHDGRFSSAVPDFHSRGSLVEAVAP